jgi:hypothetical protein
MKGIAALGIAVSCALLVLICLHGRKSLSYSELEQESSQPQSRLKSFHRHGHKQAQQDMMQLTFEKSPADSDKLPFHQHGHRQSQQDTSQLTFNKNPSNSDRVPFHQHGHKQPQQDAMQLTFDKFPSNSDKLPLHQYGHKQPQQDAMQLTFDDNPPHTQRPVVYQQGTKQPQQYSVQLTLNTPTKPTVQAPNKQLQAIQKKLVASRQRLARDNLKLRHVLDMYQNSVVAQQNQVAKLTKESQANNNSDDEASSDQQTQEENADDTTTHAYNAHEEALKRMYRKFREKPDDHNSVDDNDDDHNGIDDSNTNAHHDYDDEGNDIDVSNNGPDHQGVETLTNRESDIQNTYHDSSTSNNTNNKNLVSGAGDKDPELEKICTGDERTKGTPITPSASGPEWGLQLSVRRRPRATHEV